MSRKENTHTNTRRNPRVSLRVLVGICVVLPVLGAGAYWLLKSKPELPAAVTPVASQAIELPEEKPPAPTQSSLSVARAFTAAQTQAERLKWVRHTRQVTRHLPAYSAQARSAPVLKLVPMGAASNGDIEFDRFAAHFEGGGRRLLCVVNTPEGPRVDWDCYARYCTAPWPQILANKATTAEVRVFAKSANYYNFTYRDETQWKCFRLTSPDLGSPIYAYAKRGSKTHKTLQRGVARAGKAGQRVILWISGTPSGTSRRQFTIQRVSAIGWVKGIRLPGV